MFNSNRFLDLQAPIAKGALYFVVIFFVLAVSLSTIPVLAHSDESHGVPVPYLGKPATDSVDFKLNSRYLTMSDGVKIAISVYLTKQLVENESVPTMIHQSRY
jgi:hypothetical protein